MKLWWVLAAALLSPRAAEASSPVARAAIFPSVIKDADVLGELNAEALYDAVTRALEYAIDLEPVPREELESLIPGAAAYCGSDLHCLSLRLRGAEIRFAVEVIVNQALERPIVTAQLVDTSKEEPVAREVAEIERAVGPARAVIARVIDRLLARAGRITGGRARITLRPADAQLIVVPTPARRSLDGTALTAAPGNYHLSAHRDGYADLTRALIIRAGEETAVELTMEETSSFSSTWLWVGLGAVAVAGGAIAAAVLLRPHELELCQGDAAACRGAR